MSSAAIPSVLISSIHLWLCTVLVNNLKASTFHQIW